MCVCVCVCVCEGVKSFWLSHRFDARGPADISPEQCAAGQEEEDESGGE